MQTNVKNCVGLDVHKVMIMAAIRKETPYGVQEIGLINGEPIVKLVGWD
ncbi:hypothetical protein [Sansalvadorimonas verongulae]|nr:hypothetical protein [Sansalvadorimonas verongulae]